MLLFRKKWNILINILTLSLSYQEFEWLINSTRNKHHRPKKSIIIYLQIEQEMVLLYKFASAGYHSQIRYCKYTSSRRISAASPGASSIDLYVKSDKTKSMRFNQDGVISSLNGRPLKLVVQFIYFGCNISSTESDVNIYLGKAWVVIDRLSTTWESDLHDKNKTGILLALASTTVRLHHWDFNKNPWEKATREQHKNAMCCFQQILETAPLKKLQLYGHLSHISQTILVRRAILVGHYWSSTEAKLIH